MAGADRPGRPSEGSGGVVPAERLNGTSDGITRAAELLLGGGVVAFPTDTVYGLGVLAEDTGAVDRLYEIKRRPADRRLVVMVHAPAAARALVQVDARAHNLMRRWWPGALTLVLPTLSGDGSLALRIPDHPVALALLRAVGRPLATTSANLSGQPPAAEPAALAELSGLDAILTAGPAPGGLASSLLDLTSENPELLRAGPIRWEQLFGPA